MHVLWLKDIRPRAQDARVVLYMLRPFFALRYVPTIMNTERARTRVGLATNLREATEILVRVSEVRLALPSPWLGLRHPTSRTHDTAGIYIIVLAIKALEL